MCVQLGREKERQKAKESKCYNLSFTCVYQLHDFLLKHVWMVSSLGCVGKGSATKTVGLKDAVTRSKSNQRKVVGCYFQFLCYPCFLGDL